MKNNIPLLSDEAKEFLNKVVNGHGRIGADGRRYRDGFWTQRSDGKIDVDACVWAQEKKDLHLFLGKEIFFGEVGGDFDCSVTNITSLEGVPEKVGGNFNCSATKITSLKGAPKEVSGKFNCSATKITSLKGAPEKVGGNLYCGGTYITSLEGAPKEVGGNFDCSYIKTLISLKGSPEYVGGHFDCYYTKITNIDDLKQVQVVGNIYSNHRSRLEDEEDL